MIWNQRLMMMMMVVVLLRVVRIMMIVEMQRLAWRSHFGKLFGHDFWGHVEWAAVTVFLIATTAAKSTIKIIIIAVANVFIDSDYIAAVITRSLSWLQLLLGILFIRGFGAIPFFATCECLKHPILDIIIVFTTINLLIFWRWNVTFNETWLDRSLKFTLFLRGLW